MHLFSPSGFRILCTILVVGLTTTLTSTLNAQQPPTDGLRLWINAGGDVIADEFDVVTNWFDEAPIINTGDTVFNHSETVRGDPTLTTFSFPNGDLPVIDFDGDDGFTMTEDADLHLTSEMSIYAVVVPGAGASQIIVSNYVDLCGFGFGISDALAGSVKWFTAGAGVGDSLESGLVDLSVGGPTLLAATYNNGDKVSYKDGDILNQSSPGTVDYECGAQLTVGNLDFGRQFFTGSIAEILIYDTVDDTQRSEVSAYVANKYGAFIAVAAPSDLSCTRPIPGNVNLSWTNNDSYDAISIVRDGVEVTQLAGNAVNHTDAGVPAGFLSYEVVGIRSGIQAGGAVCAVPVTTGDPPPAAGLRLWLDAANLVVGESDAVTLWPDLASSIAPGDVSNNSDGVRGEPIATTHTFPAGDLPVVVFDGDDGFEMSNDSDLYLTTQMSIYAVIVPDSALSQIVIANYVDLCGFGLGISDGIDDSFKWFTANPPDSLESGEADYTAGVPLVLGATFNNGSKVSYRNGALLEESTPGSVDYGCGAQLTVGNLDIGRQFFTGSIAEILVYDTVDDVQRTEVHDYFEDKYGDFFAVDRPVDLVCDRPTVGTVNLSWTNTDVYESIAILRDGVELTQVAGSAENFTDNGVPAGVHSYQVDATRDGISASSELCAAPEPVTNPPPSDGLRLWLDAGNALVGDGGVVELWPDLAKTQVPADVSNDTNGVRGEPLASTHGFPAGDRPVIAFDGDDGFQLGNDSDLYLTEQMSIFAVIVPDDTPSQIVIANFADICGFGLGVSDNAAGEFKWFTANPIDSLESEGIDFASGLPLILGATYDFGVKTSYRNGTVIAQSAPGDIQYGCNAQLTVGNLDTGRQFFSGLIAEILVYDVVGDLDRAAVENYLAAKYGTFAELLPPSNLMCSHEAGDQVLLSWDNDSEYDSIRVLREGEEIALLPGDATSHEDSDALPSGLYTYQVRGVKDGTELGPFCTLSVINGATITALTWNSADDTGLAGGIERWNTQYQDPAWDIGVTERDLLDTIAEFDPGNVAGFWLNDPDDLSVDIELMPCQTRTFTLAVGRNLDPLDNFFYNINIFFNAEQLLAPTGAPGISVWALSSTVAPDSGGPFPSFAANSQITMGWPIGDVNGSGSLIYDVPAGNISVEVTDFVVFQQAALNGGAGVDFGSNQEPGGLKFTDGPDGGPDLVAEITLTTRFLDGTPCGNGDDPQFRRGDHDGSGLADITDALNLLGFLFLGTTPPICGNASDFDNSGLLDITDALILLGHLFLGQPNALPAPGTSCGPNPDTPQPGIPPIPPQEASDLGCEQYPGDAFPGAGCP